MARGPISPPTSPITATSSPRGFANLIDVWGADHGGYVKRMQAAVKAVTDGQAALDVKMCQLVNLFDKGEPVRMSKRAGTFVTLREVVDEVGKDVFRFMMLTRRNDQALDFDFAKVTEQSKDNPVFYVQYAHARAASVMRHAAEAFAPEALTDQALVTAALDRLTDPAELALIRQLAQWPRLVESAAEAHEPHRIAFYLQEVAAQFHMLWNKGRDEATLRFILASDPDLTRARLALVRGVAIVDCLRACRPRRQAGRGNVSMAYHLDQIDPDERGGFYADEDEEEYAPRSRRVLRIAGALVVMGIFAGGLWFAYTLGMRHTGGSGDSGEIPLIRADNRPIKVKPENPGGMQIPDRDMFIYGQQRPEVEHLLPPPEQPMALPAPPAPKPVVSASADARPRRAINGRPRLGTAPARTQPEQSAGLPPANPHPMPSKPAEAVLPTRKSGRGATSARLGAQRGRCARGMGSHQAEQPGFAGPPYGGGDSRRSRRQRRLLPYPDGAGRGFGDR